MKTIFSLDAESNGLWGRPFMIAAIVYQDEVECDSIVLRLPNNFVKDEWTRENVLKEIESTPVNCKTYNELLRKFAEFYLKYKNADIICHMGYIVEAFLFREMHRIGVIGDFDAPFALLDVSGNLDQISESPVSVEKYASKRKLAIEKKYGNTHNPLFDCEVAARVYMNIKKQAIKKCCETYFLFENIFIHLQHN